MASSEDSNYTRIRVIGKGSYGEVWLVKYKTDKKQYVLKKMDIHNASKRERKAAELEAKLLSSLHHPNIVAYKDSFQGHDGFLYIAMGFCEGGDMYAKLKDQKGISLKERQLVEWFVQIAMALQYLHERNILHRDLKTQNIFLTKSRIIKLGDLGIARVLDNSKEMATTLIGTPYYMSPELFSNKPYNHKSDVWALGCCVYEMATLKHAFNAKDMNSLVYKILRGKMPPMPKCYSAELNLLIRAMLSYNPDKRPSVNRILRDGYIKRNIAVFLEGTKRRKETIETNKKLDSSISSDSCDSAIYSCSSSIKKISLSDSGDSGDLQPLNAGDDLSIIDEELASKKFTAPAPVDKEADKEAELPIPNAPFVVVVTDEIDGQRRRSNSDCSEPTGDDVDGRRASTDPANQRPNLAGSANSGEECCHELKRKKRLHLLRIADDRLYRSSSDSSIKSRHQRQHQCKLCAAPRRKAANLSARARHRVRTDADTPRISKSVDIERIPKDIDVITSKSVDSLPKENPKSLHRQPSITEPDDSSSDSEESDELKQQRHKRQELSGYFNALDTTLAQQASDDEKEADDDDDDDTTLHDDAVATLIPHVGADSIDGVDIERADDTITPLDKKPTDSRREAFNNQTYIVTKPKVLINNPCCQQTGATIGASMTTTGRLGERIAMLRKDCIQNLGISLLKGAYDILEEFETEELEDKLVRLLGNENFDLYAGKIWQLKFCEEAAFGQF